MEQSLRTSYVNVLLQIMMERLLLQRSPNTAQEQNAEESALPVRLMIKTPFLLTRILLKLLRKKLNLTLWIGVMPKKESTFSYK